MDNFQLTKVAQAVHSVYSFSSSHRWIACPASIRMSKGYVNTTNDAAERGTAEHGLGEFCISVGVEPKDCIGLTFNGIEVDTEMSNGATIYKSLVEMLTLRYGVRPLLEQRVVMSSLGRQDVYGTTDCAFIVLRDRLLHGIDFKGGRGVVDVDDNSQLIGYAIAMLDTYNLWDKVDKVVNTIVQPHYDHIQGPVRDITYTVEELRKWQLVYASAVMKADDPSTKPVAGEHCHYCPASANCRARMEYTLKNAYTDCPIENISIGELEVIYSEIRSVKRFLEDIENRVLSEARNGVNFKNFKLVESYSRAICTDEKALLAKAKELGVDPVKLFIDPRLVGKTKAAEVLPKAIVAQYYRTPPSSSTVVPLTDRRPAMRVGKAVGIFQPITVEAKPSAVGVFQPIEG